MSSQSQKNHPLFVDEILVDTPREVGGVPLKMAANRYYTTSAAISSDNDVTLLFAHANGTHKEHWEPVIESLFRSQTPGDTDGSRSCWNIREAWAFDALTHGESAVVNTALRSANSIEKIGLIPDWAEAIAAFVKSRLASHRLVLVGHSAGAIASLYSLKHFSQVPYEAIIIIEPAMVDRQVFQENIDDRNTQLKWLIKGTRAMRSEWESRAAAYEWISKRVPWKQWDARVRCLYVNHGLRLINELDGSSTVSTKCTRNDEVAIYTEPEANFEAVEQIEAFCKRLPIHVVFGAEVGLVPKYCNDNVVDKAKGREVASVTYVEGAGHLVVQEQPERTAEIIFKILDDISSLRNQQARL